jgi:hypothetical protein
MAKSFRQQFKSPWLLVLLLLMGGLIGDAVASILPRSLNFLKAIGTLGISPTTLNIHFFKLTFGLTFDFGILTVLGLFLGFLLYRGM